MKITHCHCNAFHTILISRESYGSLYPTVQAIAGGVEIPKAGTQVNAHMLGLEHPVASGTSSHGGRFDLEETLGAGDIAGVCGKRLVFVNLVRRRGVVLHESRRHMFWRKWTGDGRSQPSINTIEQKDHTYSAMWTVVCRLGAYRRAGSTQRG